MSLARWVAILHDPESMHRNSGSKIVTKNRSSRKETVSSDESVRKVIAYQIHEDDTAPITPARRERKWMEAAEKKAPYRCLPLVVANQHGWEILSTHHFRAPWDGTSGAAGLFVGHRSGAGELHLTSPL